MLESALKYSNLVCMSIGWEIIVTAVAADRTSIECCRAVRRREPEDRPPHRTI